jgi:predicted signal transduction protein with EAL and GGDEF domain
MELSRPIAERVRAGFENAGLVVAGHAIGATVSIGAATSYDLVTNIDALIARADAALYRAKGAGRNRLRTAKVDLSSDAARLIAAARRPTAKLRGLWRRDSAA